MQIITQNAISYLTGTINNRLMVSINRKANEFATDTKQRPRKPTDASYLDYLECRAGLLDKPNEFVGVLGAMRPSDPWMMWPGAPACRPPNSLIIQL